MGRSLHIQNLVANYTKDRISLATIAALKKTIESSLRKWDVKVNDTQDALKELLERNKDLFVQDKKTQDIILKGRNNLQEEVFFYFNSQLDMDFKEKYLELMKTLGKVG
ncbi:MAG: hypothetical protein NTX91_00620 [candidate division SR1 bacterium]|nr:hypothetical protein [candidate division SR1 bacterium]